MSFAASDTGNYYSLRAEHEKAVKFFRRATQLDRTYLAAWTLMGHEYVEMKNSHAAIEAYRKAVGTYQAAVNTTSFSAYQLNDLCGVTSQMSIERITGRGMVSLRRTNC